MVAVPVVLMIAMGMLVGIFAGGRGGIEPAPASAALAAEARRVGWWSWGGLAVGAILAGADDDLGWAGRVLTTSCSPGTSSSRGPWPGWFYSGPLLAVVGVGLVLAAVALRAVVDRPRLAVEQLAPVTVGGGAAGEGADAGALALDEALRRWSARRVVAACAMVVALPLLGMASVAAVVLAGAECLHAGGRVAGAALVVAAPLAAVLLGWSVQALLIPAGLRAGSAGAGRA